MATDRNGQGNSAEINATVIVSPPNGETPIEVTNSTTDTATKPPTLTCQPTFVQLAPTVPLLESTPLDTQVFWSPLQLTSDKCKANFKISGKAIDYFKVDPETGSISVVKPLNYKELKANGSFESEFITGGNLKLLIMVNITNSDETAELPLTITLFNEDSPVTVDGITKSGRFVSTTSSENESTI